MKSPDPKKFRSHLWFNNSENPGMTALYLERYLNYGFTRKELQSGKPIIGIAQSGSDLSPCNRIHVELAHRVREGIRSAGGIAFEFPTHPIQESGKRPTAALDRNLAYLGLVEILHSYPLDGVVLTTGCDKTTPAMLMALATVNLPGIVLSGGPMLDGQYRGELAGSGMAIWDSRYRLAKGEIDYEEFIEIVASSAPSAGYCNTMGTASTMNCLAEALGMSLTGCASIPAPYRERGQIAYDTGVRITEMVHQDLKPSDILTYKAFKNSILVNSAIGGSTNAQPHITAIARHIGIELPIQIWEEVGYDVPLLVDMQPAGKYLSEAFHRAGGVPTVMGELQKNEKLHTDCMTVSGKTIGENLKNHKNLYPTHWEKVIRPYENPLKKSAGFKVLRGNLFESAIMKTSVISKEFYQCYLSSPGQEGIFTGTAVVFEGSEDYHERIEDDSLNIDEKSILVIRGAGPIGWPGSAEVVNMQPPKKLIQKGVKFLPCIGDGRQSGTSHSPSILHASPEGAIAGGIACLKTGDRIKIDLNQGTANILISEEELRQRKGALKLPELHNQTPWQEIYRKTVGSLETGACVELATSYQNIRKFTPRDSH